MDLWICGFVDSGSKCTPEPWGFEDLRLRFSEDLGSTVQNMMKLRSKYGEIHILCTTTFCPPSVPQMGDMGDIC